MSSSVSIENCFLWEPLTVHLHAWVPGHTWPDPEAATALGRGPDSSWDSVCLSPVSCDLIFCLLSASLYTNAFRHTCTSPGWLSTSSISSFVLCTRQVCHTHMEVFCVALPAWKDLCVPSSKEFSKQRALPTWKVRPETRPMATLGPYAKAVVSNL